MTVGVRGVRSLTLRGRRLEADDISRNAGA